MSFLIISISAVLASMVAFLSGFGFLTLVMPVLALFLPISLAIAVTALAHLLHTVMKLGFTFRFVHLSITVRFGCIALLCAIPGTLFLKYVSGLNPFYVYHLVNFKVEMTFLKVAAGVILLTVAAIEGRKEIALRMNLIPSAVVSGFIGGLTGNQGAFRSVFLLRQGLNKREFIATGAAISLIVDVGRLYFYYRLFPSWKDFLPELVPALVGSVVGVFLGMFFLKKISLYHIRGLVLSLLCIFGVAFLLGLL